jgi:hypothetical protein
MVLLFGKGKLYIFNFYLYLKVQSVTYMLIIRREEKKRKNICWCCSKEGLLFLYMFLSFLAKRGLRQYSCIHRKSANS